MKLGLKTRFHLVFVIPRHSEGENLYVNAFMGLNKHKEHM